MRHRIICAVFAAMLASVTTAYAEPASGPREDLNQTFTTTKPNTATGLDFTARYHAAGDPNGNPPFLKRMVFHAPDGFRYDTSVPDQCTAPDALLEVEGPAACPPGSLIGKGTTEGIFFYPFTDTVFDHFHHNLYILNNANEQIILVESEGFTVQRGKMSPDGSTEFVTTTCFPAPPAGAPCADDYIMQLATSTSIDAITKGNSAYAKTPQHCPKSGYWESTIHYEWADGNVDDVVSRQPCSPSGA